MGVSVGEVVGLSDGEVVGVVVVGPLVGNSVGFKAGELVGDVVGIYVGFLDGDLVGGSVEEHPQAFLVSSISNWLHCPKGESEHPPAAAMSEQVKPFRKMEYGHPLFLQTTGASVLISDGSQI